MPLLFLKPESRGFAALEIFGYSGFDPQLVLTYSSRSCYAFSF